MADGFINLCEHIDSTIRLDGTMRDLFPGRIVNLHWGWAPSEKSNDPAMPYIVWKIETADTEEPWSFEQGPMVFSVYDYHNNSRRTLQICSRLKILFVRRFYETVAGVTGLRIWRDGKDIDLSSTTRNNMVWRRDCFYQVRYQNSGLVDDVVALS